ncbi:MAG: DNA topoisomerase 4 subunit A, partial [Anaerolineales bacterium]|nr:DNA topoisomerase 4 subunit A [Anaerolineales bacterium]
MEIGLVRSIDIDHEMQQAYLDYAMSTIVARALPDARDGLKPVHRRILYAMYDMGMRPESPYKKSARIVGEVMGKYHPHGDAAVYESMARMAQDFAMRVLLVEGQGNFGSVDGDPPAAMRYTEARLASPALELLADIRKNTVNFTPNFDGSLQEPEVLPAALPNLLVNGATGIAVGMSTNIPPHNLGEVVDALVYMLDNWEKMDDISVEALMRFIQGPDFPTGGVILQHKEDEDLTVAYGSGRGKITVQAKAYVEDTGRGRSRIIVTELPYMTNKSTLIERIAELAREGRLEGISDLRDESDRQGMRIVIELSKTAVPEEVLQKLYKDTPMRSTFGIILLALVDGEPRMLSLKQALRVYLDHRLVIIRRRAEFDLERARARAHILEGLRIALKNLDEVISTIRNAPDADVARDRLMKRFKLSELQAQAILDMQLRRLAALERKKIEEEYKELLLEIKNLEALLRSPVKMRQMVADELKLVKQSYADRRRTQIVRLKAGEAVSLPLHSPTGFVEQKTVWVSITPDGLVSRSLDEKPPRPSGNAAPRWSLPATTSDILYLAADSGETAAIFVHTLLEADSLEEGVPLHKASSLPEGSRLAALFTLPPKDKRDESSYIVTVTRQGLVKKTLAAELGGPAAKPYTLVKVNDEDALVGVRLTDGKRDLLLVTADGMAIRFSEDEVRPMGLVAAGVGGIKLQGRDEVVSLEIAPEKGEILFVASDGRAKRIPADQFPVQGRYGQGVLAWKLPRTAQVVGTAVGKPNVRLTLHLEKLAPKSLRLDEAPTATRTAVGKPVIELKPGDRILALTLLAEQPGTSSPEDKPRRSSSRKASAQADDQGTQTSFTDLLNAAP